MPLDSVCEHGRLSPQLLWPTFAEVALTKFGEKRSDLDINRFGYGDERNFLSPPARAGTGGVNAILHRLQTVAQQAKTRIRHGAMPLSAVGQRSAMLPIDSPYEIKRLILR
jgi:hypothetical protein